MNPIRTQTLLLASLLLLGAVAATPIASAANAAVTDPLEDAVIPPPCDALSVGSNTCNAVLDIALDALDYAYCYYNTAPADWLSTCL